MMTNSHFLFFLIGVLPIVVLSAGVRPGGDLVCGEHSTGILELPVGYTHPVYLKSSTKALAQLYVSSNDRRKKWCVRTGPTGVLDARWMWQAPDNEVPAVFEAYTMIIGHLSSTKQLACLNNHFSGSVLHSVGACVV